MADPSLEVMNERLVAVQDTLRPHLSDMRTALTWNGELAAALQRENLFSLDDIQEIEGQLFSNGNRIVNMLNRLPAKHLQWPSFLKCLRDCGYGVIANNFERSFNTILKTPTSSDGGASSKTKKDESSSSKSLISKALQSSAICIKKGILIIFNYEHFGDVLTSRPGTENDEKELIKAFAKCGFEVHVFKEKSLKETLETWTKFLKSLDAISNDDAIRPDFIAVAILSHGCNWEGIVEAKLPKKFTSNLPPQNEETKEALFIAATDGMFWFEQEFLTSLKAVDSLKTTNVLFLLQVCRGNKLDERDALNLQQQLESPIQLIERDQNDAVTSSKANLVVLHAARFGCQAYRNRTLGSPLIQWFCKIVNDTVEHHADKDYDLNQILLATKHYVKEHYPEASGQFQHPCVDDLFHNFLILRKVQQA